MHLGVCVCVCYMTAAEKTADDESSPPEEVSIDAVPDNHPLLNVKKLEEEGQQAFNTLLTFQSSAHISRWLMWCFMVYMAV